MITTPTTKPLQRPLACAALALLSACASSKEARQDAAPADAQAAPALLAADLPPAGPAEGALYALDVRGAFGPYRFTHLDVFPDGRAVCSNRPTRGDGKDVSNTITLPAADVAMLAQVAAQLRLPEVKVIPREPTVTDIGTTTLSHRLGNGVASVVTDGKHATDPPVDELVLALATFERQCALPAGFSSAESPK